MCEVRVKVILYKSLEKQMQCQLFFCAKFQVCSIIFCRFELVLKARVSIMNVEDAGREEKFFV